LCHNRRQPPVAAVTIKRGDYWTSPYRDLGAPPITLCEHRNALSKPSADGLKSVDEKLILQTVAAQRELTAAARLRTRTARLARARSNSSQPASPPALSLPAQQEPASIDAGALAPFAVGDRAKPAPFCSRPSSGNNCSR